MPFPLKDFKLTISHVSHRMRPDILRCLVVCVLQKAQLCFYTRVTKLSGIEKGFGLVHFKSGGEVENF